MKKALLLLGILLSGFSFGQFNTSWLNTINSTTSAGFIGLGTSTASNSANPLPEFNLQLHGTTDYSFTTPTTYTRDGDILYGYQIDYGKTTRIGLTNTTTGRTATDGAVIQMSGNNLSVLNREVGEATFGAKNLQLKFSTNNRLWLGGNINTFATSGTFNVNGGLENGLYVRSIGANTYGLSINTKATTDAIQVFATDVNPTLKNFKVTASGEVFARRYTTTLANIPDYVFESDYNLMSFSDLRTYLEINKHLPNVPSAKEYEANGVELGEMNRVLLEKVEELTLYILQMEERLKAVESAK
jgi:hypothetical protein